MAHKVYEHATPSIRQIRTSPSRRDKTELASSTRIPEQIRLIVTNQGISRPSGTSHINVPDRCPAGSVTGVRHLTETLPVSLAPRRLRFDFSVRLVLSS